MYKYINILEEYALNELNFNKKILNKTINYLINHNFINTITIEDIIIVYMEYILFKNNIKNININNTNLNKNIQHFNYFKLNTIFKTYPNNFRKFNDKNYYVKDITDNNIIKDKECAICYSSEFKFNNNNLKPVKLVNCDNNTHIFHNDCINQSLKYKNQCPVCKKIYGYLIGNLPEGTMEIKLEKKSLSGYDNYDTIILIWNLHSGEYNNIRYHSDKRIGYLPYNNDGIILTNLLIEAFQRGLLFKIGFSETRNIDNVICWNSIHIKTNPNPNTIYGYPDDTYFDRVKEELKNIGIESNEETGYGYNDLDTNINLIKF